MVLNIGPDGFIHCQGALLMFLNDIFMLYVANFKKSKMIGAFLSFKWNFEESVTGYCIDQNVYQGARLFCYHGAFEQIMKKTSKQCFHIYMNDYKRDAFVCKFDVDEQSYIVNANNVCLLEQKIQSQQTDDYYSMAEFDHIFCHKVDANGRHFIEKDLEYYILKKRGLI